MKISGQVKSGKNKIANATINLFEGNAKVNSTISNANGDFTFNLNYDKLYTIEIAAAEYASKKVLVDTKIPEKDLIYKYTFSVELFPKVEGVDYSALNKPVTKIIYNPEADAFDYDIPYTESMRKQIEQITSQIESVKKQSYNQIVAKADEKFKNQAYEEAIELYEKAIDIDPYNDYPDKQIMQCEKLIAQTRNNEANYNKYIAQGDNLFSKQDYKNAKTAYQNASNLKPTEQYPKTKIAEIDKILAESANQAKEEQYKSAVAKGDAALSKQLFDEAKSAYNQALSIKPNETYPKTKLAEIDKLLADKAAKEKAEAEAKAKEEQYKSAIAKGDAALSKQLFDEA
ncbi:MAG: carboxypeptidase regulatory-like domain-containing protein, partial [Bacteroidales bacterium]|nr:carboxypeptidase regulatory-like domain-containing protein [Bacteroidales bacterium]